MSRIFGINQDHDSFPSFTMLCMIGLTVWLIFNTMFDIWDVMGWDGMGWYRVKCYCYGMGKHGIWVNLNMK